VLRVDRALQVDREVSAADGAALHKAQVYNCIMSGTKGHLGTWGQTGDVGLLPGSRWAEYKLPTPTLTRSPGANSPEGCASTRSILKTWVRACKGGAPACSNFSVAGAYTNGWCWGSGHAL